MKLFFRFAVLVILFTFVLIQDDVSSSFAQENLVTFHDAVWPERGIYWSADEEMVVILSDDRLQAWDVNTGEKSLKRPNLYLLIFP